MAILSAQKQIGSLFPYEWLGTYKVLEPKSSYLMFTEFISLLKKMSYQVCLP